jgi:hypothetical protein
MKVEYWLFGGGAFIFVPFGLIYGYFTHWREPVGVAGLFLAAGLSALVGFYLWWTSRKLDDRPEDDPTAPISAAEGEYGFFSPHSWWPLPLAAGAALMFLGLAVGWWLVIIGTVVGGMALIGWTFEYFRGENAV